MKKYIDKIAIVSDNELSIIIGMQNGKKGFYIINKFKENFIIDYCDTKGYSNIFLLKENSYTFVAFIRSSYTFELKSGVNRYQIKLDSQKHLIENFNDESEDILFLRFEIEKLEAQKILYLDLDNVVVHFDSAFKKVESKVLQEYEGRLDEVPGIFSLMLPYNNSINIIEKLNKDYNIFFLSTSPWENPSAWSDKLNWIKRYFPIIGYKRLILSHHKNLNSGDFLVDDRTANGAKSFKGEHIMFGNEGFVTWVEIYNYLKRN